MRVVTQEDIRQINILYSQLKTYAAVSRATGFAPSTVKKYVIVGFKPVDEKKIKKFDKELKDFDATLFLHKDWGEMCELTEEEQLEVKEIWEELEL